MPFPYKSQRFQNQGRSGTLASDNPVVYAVGNPVAGSNGVVCGNAVWAAPAGGSTQTVFNPVTYNNSGSGVPVGIALSVIQGTILSGDATMVVRKGQSVMVVVRGDLFMKAPANVTIGQKAFANLTTGEIAFAAAGATVSGAVETSWKVMLAGSSGDSVIISNW